MPSRHHEWRSSAGRPRAALLVLALHALLLLVWLHQTGRISVRPSAATSRITLSWVLPSPRVRDTIPQARTIGSTRLVAAPLHPSLAATTRPHEQGLSNPSPQATASAQSSLLLVLPAASAPEPDLPSSTRMGALLRNDATRQVLRQAGQQALLAERAEAATGMAIQRQDTALAEQVQQSARGDCAKGEFAGGGMGLLSLPALAYAAAAGKCAR